MSRTRLFLGVCLALALGLLIIVPLIGGAFAEHDVSEDVAQGFALWRADDCAGCHTLDGQGGPYAPDLTRIYSLRGDNYLREFLLNPGMFYPDAARVMPQLGLTVTEIAQLTAFLKWVDGQASAFPPRPMNVSGGLPKNVAMARSFAQKLNDKPLNSPIAFLKTQK